LAPIWPAYHLNQLVLSAAGLAATGSMLVHSATLITVTLLFALFAVKRLRIQN